MFDIEGFGLPEISLTTLNMLIGYCVYEVRKVRSDFKRELKGVEKNQDRLDILDGFCSDLAEDKFDSEHVSEGRQPQPQIHPQIKKLVNEV